MWLKYLYIKKKFLLRIIFDFKYGEINLMLKYYHNKVLKLRNTITIFNNKC